MSKHRKADKGLRKQPAMLNQHGGYHRARKRELEEKAAEEDFRNEIKELEEDDEYEDTVEDPDLEDILDDNES